MSLYDNMTRNGLVRPLDGRVLGGVCAGLGRRFGIDPWPARLLFILVLMVLPGSQLLIYPILWILMPSEVRPPYPPAGQYPGGPHGQYTYPAQDAGQYPAPAPSQPYPSDAGPQSGAGSADPQR